METGSTGGVLGWAFVLVGVPVWFASAVQVAVNLPRGRLITTGPFRRVLHCSEGSAHSPVFEEPERALKILLEDVVRGRSDLADPLPPGPPAEIP